MSFVSISNKSTAIKILINFRPFKHILNIQLFKQFFQSFIINALVTFDKEPFKFSATIVDRTFSSFHFVAKTKMIIHEGTKGRERIRAIEIRASLPAPGKIKDGSSIEEYCKTFPEHWKSFKCHQVYYWLFISLSLLLCSTSSSSFYRTPSTISNAPYPRHRATVL